MKIKCQSQSLQNAAMLITKATKVVALTGAGSSTPSGIPDFRSRGSGLWTRYSPFDVASLTAFRRNPTQFYEWFRPFAYQLNNAEPNSAHHALARLEQLKFLNTIITQNIDGLHQRAGSINVLEVHGSLETLTCIGCYKKVSAIGYKTPFIDDGKIPYCNYCGKILKPDIVLFEEQLPAKIWGKACRVALTSDLMIVAGTSLVVYPVAQLPENAKKNGAKIIVVNKSSTYMDKHADVVIQGDISEILPAITQNIDE